MPAIKSFKNIPFKLLFPKLEKVKNNIRFSFRFEPDIKSNEQFYMLSATFKDRLGRESQIDELLSFDGKKKTSVELLFEAESHSALITQSTVCVTFAFGTQCKYYIEYSLDYHALYLKNITKIDLNAEDLNRICNIGSSDIGDESGGGSDGSESGNGGSGENDFTTYVSIKNMQNSVFSEMYHLKNEGGRRYRVTNGELINVGVGCYIYTFELESELFIADDSPIRIYVNEVEAEGLVFHCEDFELTIMVDHMLGQSVSVAYITVEPWKLLQALANRLGDISSANRLALSIAEKGPLKSTKNPISGIKKGQTAALKAVEDDDVTVIWGPPGTGKTYTMSQIALTYLKQGKSILIVSHSNVSVDGVIKKIAELSAESGAGKYLKNGKILRYGYVRDEELAANPYATASNYTELQLPDIKKRLDDLRANKEAIKKELQKVARQGGSNQIRLDLIKKQLNVQEQIKNLQNNISQNEKEYVKNAAIIGSTISKVLVYKLFSDRKFDIVMFDEVSMAYTAQVVAAASYAWDKFVCVGDFLQLAPIAISSAKNVLSKDIFSYLGIVDGNGNMYYHPWLVMLDEQRRMHPDIADFSSTYFYKGLLRNHVSVICGRDDIVNQDPFSGKAVNLVDITDVYAAAYKNNDNSRFNLLSAVIAFSIALQAEGEADVTVGIITPYAAQMRLIRALIKDYRDTNRKTRIRCSTVHQFQGSECDVIIFDAVESYPSKKAGFLMSKNDNNNIIRLINVAVTRARGKLIVVANDRFWHNRFKEVNHPLVQLLNYIRRRGNVVDYNSKTIGPFLRSLGYGNGIRFYSSPDNCKEDLESDFKKSAGKVVLSIPTGELVEKYNLTYPLIRDAYKRKMTIMMKSNGYHQLPNQWKGFCHDSDNAVFPVIEFDNHIIWYELPLIKGSYEDGGTHTTGERALCRISGKYIAELFNSLADFEYIEKNGLKMPITPKDPKIHIDIGGDHFPGLADHIQENYVCHKCGAPMVLRTSAKGKTYVHCSKCSEIEYLTPEVVNEYIEKIRFKCPHDGMRPVARVGRTGLYIRCKCGTFFKPTEI